MIEKVAVAALVVVVGCGERTPAATSSPTSARGRIEAFAIAASSGKVDRIGRSDAAFVPDGVNDLVFTAIVEGPAVALVVVSVDGAGVADGVLHADTFVGEQVPPLEVSSDVKLGKRTFGVGVYEGGMLLNAKDGSLPMLAAGPHELTLHVSAPDASRRSFRAFAVFDDRSVAASVVAR